jgi:phosphomethylpyrimidine synthase
MTQLESAKKGVITPLVRKIAASEHLPAKLISERIKEGKIVIPLNLAHKIKKPCAIGLGLRTKINANFGTSTDNQEINNELKKLYVACRYGADAVMDLSVGKNPQKMRKEVLRRSPVPVGTVPVYEVAVNARETSGNFLDFSAADVLRVLKEQAEDGVDFFTIHAGVNRKSIAALKANKRLLDIVSRGGALIAGWMSRHKQENPFFEYFDQILKIAYEHDVTLSLGDGLRPGSIWDATDKPQLAELKILGELAARARNRNVQVMIEGPGHVPLNQIEKNVKLEKKVCRGAPFYVLGPLVTDVAAGYDHITSAIGGSIAASAGADFLCYVTPSEHLRHPSVNDVRDGVIASKIAAHAADIVKGVPQAKHWDKLMSQARRKRDWKTQANLSIDPDKAKEYRSSSRPHLTDVCTMCGEYCPIKLTGECLK